MKLVSPEPRVDDRRTKFGAQYVPILGLFFAAAAVAAVFASTTTSQRVANTLYNDEEQFYCDPSGKVQSSSHASSNALYWNSNLFLSVTLGFGGLTFPAAKAIDIVFDLVVGRGSQILATIAVYPVIRRAILRSMEKREISLALLATLLLDQLSVRSLYALGWGGGCQTRRRQKPPESVGVLRGFDWRLALIFLITAHVMCMPTWLSAMTSYQTASVPFIQLPDSTEYVPTSGLTTPNLVIEDGYRIGLPQVFPMTPEKDGPLFGVVDGYSSAMGNDMYGNFGAPVWQLWNETISVPYLRALRNAGYKISHQDGIEIFNETIAAAPYSKTYTDPSNSSHPLWSFTIWPHNATYNAANAWDLDLFTSTITVGAQIYDLAAPPLSCTNDIGYDSTAYMSYGNTTLDQEYIQSNAKCLPSAQYLWGFSSLMLFTFSNLSIFVSLLVLVLHYDAYWNSSAARYVSDINLYRDILDLADALHKHYGIAEADRMSGRDLQRAMQRRPATACLEIDGLRDNRGKKTNARMASAITRSWKLTQDWFWTVVAPWSLTVYRKTLRKRDHSDDGSGESAEIHLIHMGKRAEG